MIQTVRLHTQAVELLLKHHILTSYVGEWGGYLNLTPTVRRKMLDLGDTRYMYEKHGEREMVEKIEEHEEREMINEEQEQSHNPQHVWMSLHEVKNE